MSHERYRRRADEAFQKRAAVVRQIREQQWAATQQCNLRPSANTHHLSAHNRPEWDPDVEIKRRHVSPLVINQRVGTFIEPPKGRYVPSYYDAYYTEPFSHKHRRGISAAERVIQDRLSAADTAARIRSAVDRRHSGGGGTSSVGGDGGGDDLLSGDRIYFPGHRPGTPGTRQRKQRFVQEHCKSHGVPLDVFDAELCPLPDQLQLVDDPPSLNTATPGRWRRRRQQQKTQQQQQQQQAVTHGGWSAATPDSDSAALSSQSLAYEPATPSSLGATSFRLRGDATWRGGDSPGPPSSSGRSRQRHEQPQDSGAAGPRRWLMEEEELQRAAKAATSAWAGRGGGEAPVAGEPDWAADGHSHLVTTPREDGQSAIASAATQGSEASRRGRGGSGGDVQNRDPEDIAAFYYQKLIDECPPSRLFDELYK